MPVSSCLRELLLWKEDKKETLLLLSYSPSCMGRYECFLGAGELVFCLFWYLFSSRVGNNLAEPPKAEM